VEPDGESHHLDLADTSLTVLDTWKSPHSGGTYPSRWRLLVPKWDLSLEVVPLMNDQELNTRGSIDVTYWEGAVGVTGESNGEPVTGEGYVELTGYAGSLEGVF
jgi:predicted secreted hydrolase